MDGGIYKWRFKILKRKGNIAIAIDETKYSRQNGGHFNKDIGLSKSYALWHDGYRNQWDYDEIMPSDDDSPIFNRNDIVMMILDLNAKTLSFKINNGDKNCVFTDIATENDIEYCMCVCMSLGQDAIELIP